SKVIIGEAILQKSRFTYNTDQDSLKKHFDPNHFAINISDAELNNFLILGDTVQFNLGSFSATEEKLDFQIHELTTFFLISQQRMEFSGLKLRAGKSLISDSIVFAFNGQRNLSNFTDSVIITANLTNTVIHPSDLSLFVPLPAGLAQPVSVNSKFTGRISKFRATDVYLKIGATQFQGSLEMDGLPDINETFILLSLKRSQINFRDLAFLFDENSVSQLSPLGVLNFQGQFLGYPTDFVATGDFSSQIGRIVSDINLKINETSLDQSEYTGKLLLSNFDLGKYLNDTINFQKVSVSGNIAGKGLTLESADFTLNGTVSTVGLMGYNYQNITTNARFASKFFNGRITINDPNLEFEADGSVDLRNDLNRIKIQGSLVSAHLKNLKLSTKEVFLKTRMDIDIQGLVLDSLLGNALLNNSLLVYQGDSVALPKISLVAQKNENNRLLRLETSLFDAQAKGAFYFSNLFNDIPVLIKEYRLNIENDQTAIQKYYEQKIQTPQKYETDIEFIFKDIKPISTLLGLDLHLSKNTILTGRYTSGPTSILQAYSQIDSIVFGANHFYKTEVEINASKEFKSPETLAMLYLQSKTQEIGKIKTDFLITEVIWDRNHMEVDLSISQQATTNRFDLSSTVDFKDSTHIKLHPSTIRVLEKTWSIHPDNAILISGKEWSFKNIGFLQLNQSIKLN
ncbi:MAG: hypothetical protein OEU76_10265, partial [Cyclobacteriaceae bacterium]|nr:hypothetical protein [Cyclobacteriaceae bacterium]